MKHNIINKLYRYIPLKKLRRYFIKNAKYGAIDTISVSDKRINEEVKPIIDSIETHIVDHCNLNCRGCTHFATLAPKKFININNFINDIKELSSKISLNRFRLMGGEPLLHPDIVSFIEESRKYFEHTKLCLVTNGMLLPKMSGKFWDALRENNVQLDITKYPPLKDKFSDYLDLCDKHYVKVGDIHVANSFWFILNPKGDSNMEHSFNMCTQRTCKNLRNGKLAHCPTTVYIDFYNKYYCKNIPFNKGIDIYSNSAKDIISFLNKPVETCKFCIDQSKPWHRSLWKKTSYDENEWNY